MKHLPSVSCTAVTNTEAKAPAPHVHTQAHMQFGAQREKILPKLKRVQMPTLKRNSVVTFTPQAANYWGSKHRGENNERILPLQARAAQVTEKEPLFFGTQCVKMVHLYAPKSSGMGAWKLLEKEPKSLIFLSAFVELLRLKEFFSLNTKSYCFICFYNLH